jgi:probable HAF family extracellular repeat protein
MHPRNFPVSLKSLLFGLLALAPVSRAQQYVLTELPDLGGGYSLARGISDSGWVVGSARMLPVNSYNLAVLWAGATTVHLVGVGSSVSEALAVSKSGTIVGIADEFSLNAFRWQHGELDDLSSGIGLSSQAHDVNSSGVLVGRAGFPAFDRRAAAWDGSQWTDLGSLGGASSVANAINDAGVIVGHSDLSTGEIQAFHWKLGSMTPLGTLGGVHSAAEDINSAEVVVGYSEDPLGRPRAVSWTQGVLSNLGTLPSGESGSWARAINASGQIVGSSYSGAANFSVHATLWDAGQIIDLNSRIAPNSDWILTRAEDINQAGEIVGVGLLNGQTRGFKLTPVGFHRLILAPLLPGTAGVPNALTATWDRPGIRVEFYARLDGSGLPAVDPFLMPSGPPARYKIALGRALTDNEGVATISIPFPLSMAGQRVGLIAVEVGAGTLSNRVDYVLQ